jgi:hypothetical protein
MLAFPFAIAAWRQVPVPRPGRCTTELVVICLPTALLFTLITMIAVSVCLNR